MTNWRKDFVREWTSDGETIPAHQFSENKKIYVDMDELSSAIAKEYGGVGSNKSGLEDVFWQPPEQPHARGDVGFVNAFIDRTSTLLELYDDLVSDAPDYITKSSIGKDETGDYDVFLYDFKPENYKMTFILTTFVHGNETPSFLYLYRTMYHIVNDALTNEGLLYLRNNVRFLVVPIANPWGADQTSRNPESTHSNRASLNINGVNLNGNFPPDYRWENFDASESGWDSTTKGDAPLSEKETQHLKELLDENTDAKIYIDFHTGAQQDDYLTLQSELSWANHRMIDRTIDHLKTANETVRKVRDDNPTGRNYAVEVLGMNALTVECSYNRYDSSYSETEMNRGVRWVGNVLIQTAAEYL